MCNIKYFITAMNKKKMPIHVMNDIVAKIQPTDDKAYIMRNIRRGSSFVTDNNLIYDIDNLHISTYF